MNTERISQLETSLSNQGVLTITLNRPEKLNALTSQLMDELAQLLDHVHHDKKVRVVVITGAGRAFSAGGDFTEDVIGVVNMTAQQYRIHVERWVAPMLAISELDRPVIAAVNGLAVGGGWDLALACDIRIASTGARFKEAYVELGALSELGGAWHLPRLAGQGRAKMIAFTGGWISAAEAREWGLVEEVIDSDQFEHYIQDLASRIARGPARAIAMTKLAMNRAMTLDLRQAVDDCAGVAPTLIESYDYAEALKAFVEKRPPVFEGTAEDAMSSPREVG